MKTRHTFRCFIAFALLTVLHLTSNHLTADIIAESTFDSDLDGWTMPDISIEWRPTGGNPDGYMDWADNRFQTNDNEFVFAPSDYLGNWSAYNGTGYIEFDHILFSTGNIATVNPYEIVLSGPGGEAQWMTPGPNAPTPWTTQRADLNELDWQIQSGTWTGLLSDVSSLAIRIEIITNPPDGTGDTAGMDNIRLVNVPEPSAMAWLTMVTSMCLIRRRRHLAHQNGCRTKR